MITNPHPTSTFTPSRWRRVFSSLLLLAAFVAVIGAIASSRQPAVAAPGGGTGPFQSSKIAPWVMEHTANGQQAEFFVVLADQADLSAAANLQTKAEKGRFVLSNPVQQGADDSGADPAMAARTWARASLLLHR